MKQVSKFKSHCRLTFRVSVWSLDEWHARVPINKHPIHYRYYFFGVSSQKWLTLTSQKLPCYWVFHLQSAVVSAQKGIYSSVMWSHYSCDPPEPPRGHIRVGSNVFRYRGTFLFVWFISCTNLWLSILSPIYRFYIKNYNSSYWPLPYKYDLDTNISHAPNYWFYDNIHRF